MDGFFAALGGAGLVILIIVVLVVIGIAVVVVLLIMRAWYKVARADQALVIVGKRSRSKDGPPTNVTVIRGGGAIVNPITQRAETLSLRARQIMVKPTAQSIQGVTVDVTGVALVKVGSSPQAIAQAAERFVSQDDAIEIFTTEQLEGALRGVVATLTVEQLMRDRQELSDQIAALIKSDLDDQGLVLDSFQIQGITDQNGYIDALGAEEVSKVKRQAEIARIDAERQIRARELSTSEETLIEQTQYDRNTAASASDVGQARAEAEQAEALARAKAQQAVLLQEAENKQAELDADVKRVADARLYERQKQADADAYARVKAAEAQSQIAEQEARATRFRADADADAVRVEGEARAAAIEAEALALSKNRDAILAKRALDALVPMMTEFAKGYANVGEITVLAGGGGQGEGASSHLAGETAIGMRTMFDSVRAATGLDLSAILQGHAIGRGVASGTDAREERDPEDEKSTRRARRDAQQRERAADDDDDANEDDDSNDDGDAGGDGDSGDDFGGGGGGSDPRPQTPWSPPWATATESAPSDDPQPLPEPEPVQEPLPNVDVELSQPATVGVTSSSASAQESNSITDTVIDEAASRLRTHLRERQSRS